MRTKVAINSSTLEELSRFKYLICKANYGSEADIKEKINKLRKYTWN